MRLVTRADLDGLTCAVLLSTCDVVDAIELVHPQDVAEHRVVITADDVLTNVPYHPACGMWFDNHLLTDARATPPMLSPDGLILIGLTLDARTGLDGLPSRTNLGVLLSLHGGGGHPGAAATLVPADEADRRLQAIVAALRRNV